jgi:hypothetical protein
MLVALLIGKPAGIVLFSMGARILGAHCPSGLVLRRWQKQKWEPS